MLVLSRRKDGEIRISDDIIVTVVDIRGEVVRLGITAPRDVPIHRGEVYEEIQLRLVGGDNDPKGATA